MTTDVVSQTVRLPQDVHDAVKLKAFIEGISMNEFIIRAIKITLSKEDAQ